jgi:hypothetical protein
MRLKFRTNLLARCKRFRCRIGLKFLVALVIVGRGIEMGIDDLERIRLPPLVIRSASVR